MQNRYLTGEERNPKMREEVRDANGGIPHRGISQVLEPESGGGGQEGSFEDPGVDERLRIHEKEIVNDIRAGCPARCRPRVPNSEKNEPRNEQPHDSPLSTREINGGQAAKRINGRLGSFVH